MKINSKFEYVVDKSYKLFKAEYDTNDLPDKIHKKWHNGLIENVTYYAEFNSEDIRNKRYILHLNTELFEKKIMEVKAILYHEFTHLLDGITYGYLCEDEYKNLIASYSEIHASYIESKALYDTMHSNEYLTNKINDKYLCSINLYTQYAKDSNPLTFMSALTWTFYYMGYSLFMEEIDTKYKIQFKGFPEEYFNDLDVIYTCIKATEKRKESANKLMLTTYNLLVKSALLKYKNTKQNVWKIY